MGSPSKRVRINVGVDKDSSKTRVDRSKGVGATAPTSAVYQNAPQVKAAGDALIERGVQLAAAEDGVQAAEMNAAKARSSRDALVQSWDVAYDLYVAQVEAQSPTAEQVVGLGLTVQDRGSYAVAPPVEVRARFDVRRNAIIITVTRAPGMRSCVVEISTSAAEPRIWTRLPGTGARREVSEPEPGVTWVRAASSRAQEQSGFTEPVAVTVR